MNMKLFGKNIDPACSYCEHGHTDQEGNVVFCPKNGVVSPYYSCRRFQYAPLKRKPKGIPLLSRYKLEDFEL